MHSCGKAPGEIFWGVPTVYNGRKMSKVMAMVLSQYTEKKLHTVSSGCDEEDRRKPTNQHFTLPGKLLRANRESVVKIVN